MRSRNQQEKAQRREALLNAAQIVFFDKGFERTSMDDIASKAGFSRALLYVYFKDKKDIYRSLRIRSALVLRERMLQHINPESLGIEQIRQVGEAFYDFYSNDSDHYHCLSVDMSLSSQNSHIKQETSEHPESLEAEKCTMQVMLDVLNTGLKDGSVSSTKVSDPLQTIMYLRGALHGVVMLQSAQGSGLIQQSQHK